MKEELIKEKMLSFENGSVTVTVNFTKLMITVDVALSKTKAVG